MGAKEGGPLRRGGRGGRGGPGGRGTTSRPRQVLLLYEEGRSGPGPAAADDAVKVGCRPHTNRRQTERRQKTGAKQTGAKEKGAKQTGAKQKGAKETGAKQQGAKETGATQASATLRHGLLGVRRRPARPAQDNEPCPYLFMVLCGVLGRGRETGLPSHACLRCYRAARRHGSARRTMKRYRHSQEARDRFDN